MSLGSGTAKAAGTVTIGGSYSGHTASLSLTILDGSAITASPTSLALTAGGTALPFTVTCTKADGTTDASPTYTATSSDTGVATVSKSGTTVTVTGVAAGSCTINLGYTSVTQTATGSVGITVTAGAGTVTSVTPIFNGADASGGALLFTGTNYTFTAKDQSGNALDGTVGTWSTTDGTNAPINSTTGVCAPSAGACGATLTYTHTASGHSATIPVTVLKGGYTALLEDSAQNYTSDADFANNVWGDAGNVAGGTGPSNAKYHAASGDISHMTVMDTNPLRLFMGERTFLQQMPPSSGSNAGSAIFACSLTRGWVMRVERSAQAGESGPLGAATRYILYVSGYGGNNAEKAGPGFDFSGLNGRAEVGYASGQSNGTYYYDWFIVDNNGRGTGVSAYAEPQVSGAAVEGDGQWVVKILLVEERTHGLWSMREWVSNIGSVPTWLANVQAEFATINYASAVLSAANAFSWNFNATRQADQLFYRSIAKPKILDGTAAGNGDPFGLLGTQPTPVLTSIDVSSIARGASSVTITLTGTGFNENCYPVFSNTGIHVTPKSASPSSGNGCNLVRTGSTTFAVTVDCASGATAGAGTVKIYNAASQVSSATQVFTVT